MVRVCFVVLTTGATGTQVSDSAMALHELRNPARHSYECFTNHVRYYPDGLEPPEGLLTGLAGCQDNVHVLKAAQETVVID